MSCRFRVRSLVIAGFLILVGSSLSLASGRKVWSINLQARGYDSSSNVRIWFWRHYLVVDPDVEVCRALNNRNLARISASRPSAYPSFLERPYKTMVFDIDTHREVSLEVLVGADPTAACPQVQGWWWFGEHREDVRAAWKDRLVREDGHRGLYFNREGQPETPICRACAHHSVRWIAPYLLLMAKFSSEDKCLSAAVVDLDGETKYWLDPRKLQLGLHAVFNSTGTRFALVWRYQSGWGLIRYGLGDLMGGGDTTMDRKTIQVFSTSDGQQLFSKTLRGKHKADEYSQPDLKLALSDDGDFLAYFTNDAKILIYRLASDTSH